MQACFEVKSGKIIIIDPCYALDGITDDIAAVNIPAKNGLWYVHVSQEHSRWGGDRVHAISVIHSDYPFASGTLLPYSIAVDSGQVGIFDSTVFPTDDVRNVDDGSFYAKICDITCSGQGWGVYEQDGSINSVVTSSGYGDGLYKLYGEYRNNELVSAQVVFVDNDYEEDEDYAHDDYYPYDNGDEDEEDEE